MIDFSPFEPPKRLEDHQVEKMRRLQEGTLFLAKLLEEILPNVEDRNQAVEALKNVKTFGESAIRYGRTILTPAILASHFAPTESRDVRVVRVWMNANTFADIRKYGRDIYDPSVTRDELMRGFMGRVWNAEVFVTRKIPTGYLVVLGHDEVERTKDEDLTPGWTPRPDQLIRL